jgi:hypothetical protein
MAHFVRNVALLAALSGPGFACTIETTKSVRPVKSTSRIAEANVTWRSVFTCVMAFPLLNFFSLQLRAFLNHRAQKLLT